MTERRQGSAKNRSETVVGKAIRAVVDRASRLLEALGPQPQLRPVPIRIRDDRRNMRR